MDDILDLGQGELFIGKLETFNFERLSVRLSELIAIGAGGEIELDITSDAGSAGSQEGQARQ